MKSLLRLGIARSLACAATIAMAALCPFAASAAIILVSKGTIASGTDTTGVFGTADADLSGKTYKLMITYDDFSTAFHASSPTFEKQSGVVIGNLSVAVNGMAFARNVRQSFGAFLYVNNNGVFSELSGFQSGNDVSGQMLYAAHDLSSTSGTVTGPSIGMTAYTAMPGDVGDARFNTSGSGGTASFTASPSATYLVFPPPQLIASLSSYVQSLGLSHGTQTSFLAKLNATLSYLSSGDIASAVESINAFINEAKAQSGKKLTSAQASQMIIQAQSIIFTIGVIYST
jgi:hypothetical protein